MFCSLIFAGGGCSFFLFYKGHDFKCTYSIKYNFCDLILHLQNLEHFFNANIPAIQYYNGVLAKVQSTEGRLPEHFCNKIKSFCSIAGSKYGMYEYPSREATLQIYAAAPAHEGG